MTNSEIIERLKSGSESTFRELYDRYYYQLNTYAYHIVMCEESHDIVHDIFARMWEHRRQLTVDTNLNAYLYAAVRNSAINYLNRNKILDTNRKKIIETMLLSESAWGEEDEEILLKLSKEIEKLPEQQRAVLKLRVEGRSYEEISQELDISVKTINNHIYKAYLFLRKNLILTIFLLFR